MKIILYSINFLPELTGIGKYNGEMATWFAFQEDQAQVITAPPYYPEWKIHSGFSGRRFVSSWQQGVVVHRCPLYVPEKPTTIKRILHLASFAASSTWRLFSIWKQKPDVVFVVEPTLFCVPMALFFCKLTGAKSVLHIQDYEVDAMLGLGMAGKSGGVVGRIAYAIESWLMKRFDKVSSISFSMLEKAREKGVAPERLMFFPNWADTGFVNPQVDGSQFRHTWGFSETDQVVLYAGNMGAKQGLEIVIDAAERFVDRANVKFVMVGAGAHVDTLKQMAANKKLTNVDFKPLQAWEDVPAMLAMADVHLVVQKKGAADAVLPSKLTNILSAGGFGVVTAEPDTELGRLVVEYPGIYTCVDPENLDALCDGLTAELQRSSGVNMVARSYAEQNLDKNAILARFRQELLKLTGEH